MLDFRHYLLGHHAWRNLHFFDAHVADSLLKIHAVDRVSISEEIPRRLIPGEVLANLLRCPLRGGMLGDVEGVLSSFALPPQWVAASRRRKRALSSRNISNAITGF